MSLIGAHMLQPPICCIGSCNLAKSLETCIVWLFDIVINMNHVLIVVESLDEVNSLLQVRLS